MASETVIAHNVIVSGLLPKNMGWVDEAYRDHANVFGKGADEMHITGDLSLADFATISKNHGQPYPKLADYLHTARPGTKFITVGEKSYAVESATAPSGDIAVRLSSRSSDVTERPDPGRLSQPVIPGAPGINKAWRVARRQERAGVPDRARSGRPDAVRPLLHQLRLEQPLRDQGRLPVVAVPLRRQPVLAGQRPRCTWVGTPGSPMRRSR